jgi:hypothetical protein
MKVWSKLRARCAAVWLSHLFFRLRSSRIFLSAQLPEFVCFWLLIKQQVSIWQSLTFHQFYWNGETSSCLYGSDNCKARSILRIIWYPIPSAFLHEVRKYKVCVGLRWKEVVHLASLQDLKYGGERGGTHQMPSLEPTSLRQSGGRRTIFPLNLLILIRSLWLRVSLGTCSFLRICKCLRTILISVMHMAGAVQ